MLPEVFREFAKPKGLGQEYLENLAGFFLAAAKENGEEEAIGLTLGEDHILGPYLDVDLRRAPKTYSWLISFRQAVDQGAQLVVEKRALRLTILPPNRTRA
ncbi:MAG: hypothetical protein P3W93_008855 [Thermus sp.]|nr:hypothetical protein [Thermus sp.]